MTEARARIWLSKDGLIAFREKPTSFDADAYIHEDRARKLAEALKTCSERFHLCMVGSGSDREFADAAVEDYRELLAAYDEATGA